MEPTATHQLGAGPSCRGKPPPGSSEGKVHMGVLFQYGTAEVKGSAGFSRALGTQ